MLSCQSARNKAYLCQKYGRESWFKPTDEIFDLPLNILLIYFLSNVKLLEILKFQYLPATYNLAVKYKICKHVSQLVDLYVYRCSTFNYFISIWYFGQLHIKK
jgi:hypothetical protein